MYRFLATPKWIAFTLVVAAAAAGMMYLCLWQLDRLDDRRAFNELVEERIAQAAVPATDLLELPAEDREWRTATLVGAYRGETEVVTTSGGYLLVAPFGIDGGDTVYVDRGFVGSTAAVPEAPVGRVELTARFREAPSAARSVPDGAGYVDRIESVPDDTGVAPQGLPSLDDGPHLAYAIQWLIFGICVVIGWVLAVRRSARPNEDSREADRNDPRSIRRRHQQAVPWQDELPAARGSRSSKP